MFDRYLVGLFGPSICEVYGRASYICYLGVPALEITVGTRKGCRDRINPEFLPLHSRIALVPIRLRLKCLPKIAIRHGGILNLELPGDNVEKEMYIYTQS